MATFDYNPITGNLDLVGSGASYINGVVADSSLLPTTLGTPPLDSVYLAKAGSGVWLINRKPSGLYVRVANNGNSADWTYLGAFPEVNADGNWELYNSTDPTKELKFDLSGLPTATVRTVIAPAGNGQMLVEGQSIGSTTRNTGAFTTLTANNGTLTASAPVLDLSQTWNDGSTAFTAIKLDITNTASLSAAQGSSKYFEINVGGVPQVRFQRNFSTPVLYFGNSDTGIGSSTTTLNVYANGGAMASFGSGSGGINLRSDSPYSWSSSTNITSGNDLSLFRDAADTLAQRRGTNPQTFRLYNTFTDASNYERGFMRWSSSVFEIGTEAAGTGSNRNVRFVIGTNSATFTTSGSGLRLTVRDVLAGYGFITNTGVFRNSSGTWIARNTNDTANAPFECAECKLTGNLDISTKDIVTDTTTGTKIGTATNQLLGFYGATPVDQPATVADPAGGGTVDAEARTAINDIIDRLQELGLIA